MVLCWRNVLFDAQMRTLDQEIRIQEKHHPRKKVQKSAKKFEDPRRSRPMKMIPADHSTISIDEKLPMLSLLPSSDEDEGQEDESTGGPLPPHAIEDGGTTSYTTVHNDSFPASTRTTRSSSSSCSQGTKKKGEDVAPSTGAGEDVAPTLADQLLTLEDFHDTPSDVEGEDPAKTEKRITVLTTPPTRTPKNPPLVKHLILPRVSSVKGVESGIIVSGGETGGTSGTSSSASSSSSTDVGSSGDSYRGGRSRGAASARLEKLEKCKEEEEECEANLKLVTQHAWCMVGCSAIAGVVFLWMVAGSGVGGVPPVSMDWNTW